MISMNDCIKYLNPPKALKNQKYENSFFSNLVVNITVQSSQQNNVFLIKRGSRP